MEFEYIEISGPSDTELHLAVRNGEATLIRNPEAPRKDGAPVGIFRGPASPAFLQWLSQHGVPPAPSPAPVVRPDMPVVRVKFLAREGATSLQYLVAVPSEAATAAAMRALREQVQAQASLLEKSSALRAVWVESTGLQGDRWVVKLHNPGTLPVEVNWKQQPVRVFGLQEGALQDLTAGQSDEVKATSIPARSALEVRIPVRFPNPGKWQVRAVYQVWSGTRAEAGPVGGAAASRYLPVTAP